MTIRRRLLDCLATLAMTLLILVSAPAGAQTFPELTGRVVDQANLLEPAQEVDLTSKLAALEARTGRQFVVATVASLEGRTIEDYGYRLGRAWGIGDEQRDDGVILLVAPKEKKVRIETGYGARVFLTDVVSGRIIRELILPRFREGDFAGGIGAGAEEIIRQMSLSPQEAQRRAQQIEAQEAARSKSEGAAILPVIFIMIVFFAIVGSLARRAGGRRYRRRRHDGGISPWVILWGLNEISRASRGRSGWGGGGGFGGFGGGGGGFGGFSGGGGSFGGGGASGGW